MKEIIEKVYIKLYSEFKFIESNEKKLRSYINIQNLKNQNLSEEQLYISLLKRSKIEIFKIFSKKVNNGKLVSIFKKYYKEQKNYKDLETFGEYLKTINYSPTFEEYAQILKLVNLIIEPIIQNNINKIKNENYKFVNDNEFIIGLLETYCVINDLIDEDYDIDKNDLSETESLYLNNPVKAYLLELNNYKILKPEEQKELFIRYNNGDINAKDKLIKHNLRLVVFVVKKYGQKRMDFLEIIQEGNLGLLTAIDKFEVKKGYKFSSYAVWWIRQAVIRALSNKSHNIRIPVYLQENISKYNKAYRVLSKELNREPTLKEVAERLNISISHVQQLYNLRKDTYSLNTLVGPDKDEEFGNFIVDEKETLEENYMKTQLKDDVGKLLIEAGLNENEIKIIKCRFGFCNGGKLMSLSEIKQDFDVTTERIRQIEESALKKLRYSKATNKLAFYMTNPESALQRLKEYRTDSSVISKKTVSEIRKGITVGVQPCLNTKFERAKVIEEDDNLQIFVKKNTKENDQIINIIEVKSNIEQIEENQNKQKEKTSSKNKGSISNIYTFFNDFTEEQIDFAINLLDEDDKELLHLRYGEDLKNPMPGKMDPKQRKRANTILMLKIKKILLQIQNNQEAKKVKIMSR